MRNWAYMLIVDRLMRQEYAMARMLGYSGIEANLHVMTVCDDFKGMCQCMRADRAAKLAGGTTT